MPIATEESQTGSNVLTTTREPKGPKRAGDVGSMGDQALKDAVLVIVAGWVLLFLLSYSLRNHNV